MTYYVRLSQRNVTLLNLAYNEIVVHPVPSLAGRDCVHPVPSLAGRDCVHPVPSPGR